MSTMIVNKLNRQLDLSLPLNTCHTYVDLVQLTEAILSNLGMDGPSPKARPSTRVASNAQAKEDIVIVGQAFRLPGDINTPESFWTALIEISLFPFLLLGGITAASIVHQILRNLLLLAILLLRKLASSISRRSIILSSA